MDKDKSFKAVKDAIKKEPFAKHMDVCVLHNGEEYFYNNVYARINYNIAYMQMDVIIIWEDDTTQIDYKKLELHGSYNSNFQKFYYNNEKLCWTDGDNKISIDF